MRLVTRPVMRTVMPPVMRLVMRPGMRTVMRPVMRPGMRPVMRLVMRAAWRRKKKVKKNKKRQEASFRRMLPAGHGRNLERKEFQAHIPPLHARPVSDGPGYSDLNGEPWSKGIQSVKRSPDGDTHERISGGLRSQCQDGWPSLVSDAHHSSKSGSAGRFG